VPRVKHRAELVRASDIPKRPIEWLWRPYIPLGMLTKFAGDPKLGKSFVTASIAAAVSSGCALPMDRSPPSRGSVILMSAEDDPSRTTVPRLIAAGADLTRIHFVRSARTEIDAQEVAGTDHLITIIGADLEAIESEADALGDCKLIVIDPVTAYLTGVDDHRNTELRRVLFPLATMAERLNVAIILVHHLNKSGALQAQYRANGSIAWLAACRANHIFITDTSEPAKPRVLICNNGSNLVADVPTLAYTIEDRGAGPTVVWATEPLTISADEALRAQSRDEDEEADRREDQEWLRATLAGGPMLVQEVLALGTEQGFSRHALRRARRKIGATYKRDGFGSECYWLFPAAASTDLPPQPERP
jgi:hypothetical protein